MGTPTVRSVSSPRLYMYPRVDIASIETCESDSYYVTAYALEHRSFMILAAYALMRLVIALIAASLPHAQERDDRLDGRLPWATPIFPGSTAWRSVPPLPSGSSSTISSSASTARAVAISLPGTILCMAAAGLVGYFVAEMLIKKSFRVFRAGAKGAAIVALLSCCSALQ